MQFLITHNQDLGENWNLLEVEAPELARRCRAGQFVQIATGQPDAPFLRRPFSVYDVLPEPGPKAQRVRILYQQVGPGTRWMAQQRAGDEMDLLGPLGRPLPRFEDQEVILVGGGIGVAPLYFYCREMLADAAPHRVQVFLGARRRSLLVGLEAFERLGVPTHTSTDDGSHGHHGNVIELLEDQILSRCDSTVAGIGCGPHGMNVALRDFAVAQGLEFWISLENYMPCGFGACYGCVIEAPPGSENRFRRVCVEGPAFRATELPASM